MYTVRMDGVKSTPPWSWSAKVHPTESLSQTTCTDCTSGTNSTSLDTTMICVSVTPSWTRETQASEGLMPRVPLPVPTVNSNKGLGPKSVVNVTSYW